MKLNRWDALVLILVVFVDIWLHQLGRLGFAAGLFSGGFFAVFFLKVVSWVVRMSGKTGGDGMSNLRIISRVRSDNRVVFVIQHKILLWWVDCKLRPFRAAEFDTENKAREIIHRAGLDDIVVAKFMEEG